MWNKELRTSGLTLTLLLIFALPLSAQEGLWPMFRRLVERVGMVREPAHEKGILSWSYRTAAIDGRPPIQSSAAIGDDGRIYIGAGGSDGEVTNLYVLDSAGSLAWSYRTGPYGFIDSSPLIASSGKIYFGSKDYLLYALGSNGSLIWSYMIGDDVWTCNALGDGGEIYLGSADKGLYAVDSNASLKWSYKTGGEIASSPARGVDGRICAGSHDNNMYVLDSIGSLLWSYRTKRIVYGSPIVGSDEKLYFGSSGDHNIYALNSGGALNWSYTTGWFVDSYLTLGSDGRIFVGSFDNRLYALNSNGSLYWSYKTAVSPPFGDPPIMMPRQGSPIEGAGGTIYFGAFDNRVYALGANGSLLWSYMTARFIQTSPAIGKDGRLYIGGTDSVIYCLRPIPPR